MLKAHKRAHMLLCVKNVIQDKLNHLEERLLDQVQARTLCSPFLEVVRVAYPEA